ncbi:hypothetical protein CAI21_04925 [Alkalilimnicola ehrlichii]|uniref:DUF3108 domain-containing protein n=1 Tax=Alkalilimnicola ehrlichii TaxID=351052 RepID=A0A3E0X111_9GAMM|nr:DUF3108 domain-containing protein [Alkalilimnicola ehrlichii]RFA30423.1 hypothetical protein CAI21_04925 [Alkalilimnicola ehrlichii]RFA37976.1 hypothetical protein CAL65_06300 [Alkalilimnicola ehrlichii]
MTNRTNSARTGARANKTLSKRYWLLVTALALLTSAFQVQALPIEFNATYLASARGMALGRAEMQFERNRDGEYNYQSHLRPRGVIALLYRNEIEEKSRGVIENGQIIPHRYDYIRTGRGGREDHIDFPEQPGGVSTLHYKGDSREQQLPEHVIDQMSLHLAMMNDIAAGEEEMRYLIAQPRRLRVYAVTVKGRDEIRTREGTFEAIRVEVTGQLRIDEEDEADFDLDAAELPPYTGGDETIFWFAPDLSYLPVRIRHVDEDDGAVELELERLKSLTPDRR